MRQDFNHWGQHYPIPSTEAPAEPPVDWKLIIKMMPWIILMLGWTAWLFYLVIPTFFGTHGTTMFSIENNILFVMTGAVLMLASQTMWSLHQYIRSTLFVCVIFYLSYWF